jgi:Flp pilus assembly protein TadG
MTRQGTQRRRLGAAAIEFAFVFPFVFAIFFAFVEHGRLGMIQSLLQNAAREGGRYAAVTITDPLVDESDIVDWVNKEMLGYDASLAGYTVDVFLTDSSGNDLGDYKAAQYSQLIAVQITGTHEVWLPLVTLLPPTIDLDVRAICMAEAN